MTQTYDAVVVGSGPNGLAAAIVLAQAGRSVLVVEAASEVGGGTRSAELTLPGFVHDVCSAIHPLALASPFLRRLPLEDYGLSWAHPEVPLAHPLDDGTAAVLHRSVRQTAEGLGSDGPAYERLMGPLLAGADALGEDLLAPLRPPHHPVVLARFVLRMFRSAKGLAHAIFGSEPARALIAGLGGHAMQPLTNIPTAAFAIFTGLLAHSVGWPAARGGSHRITEAMAEYLRALGGAVKTDWRVDDLGELPPNRAVLCDVTPRELLRLAGSRLAAGYRSRLARYRYGPGVFKVDWALEGPVPWTAEACRRAGTVHVGGTLREIAAWEADVASGRHGERPYLILAQQSLFDAARAPEGRHTVWAYCHVPNGSTVDMTEGVEAQVERFAPGFRDRILARHVMPPGAMERYNANYVGGDINGGLQDLRQLVARPALRLSPYTTPDRSLYLCSSSTPPGGGVHGMCGYFAATAALRRAPWR